MKINLVSVLSLKLGEPRRRGSSEYEFECPWCGSNGKKKLGINLSKKLFHCFRCHESGHLSELLKKLNIDFELGPTTPPITQPKIALPTEIPGFSTFGELPSSFNLSVYENYLMQRAGMRLSDTHKMGWGLSFDPKWSGRLVIPIKIDGVLVSFLGRAVYPWVEPKEKGPSTRDGWWSRSEVMYGLDTVDEDDDLVLVEGIWDREAVLTAYNEGNVSCIALLGSSLSEVNAGRIAAKRPASVTLLMDGDEAGVHGAKQIVTRLQKRYKGEIRVAVMPEGKDPDEIHHDVLMTICDGATPAGPWLMHHSGKRSNRL